MAEVWRETAGGSARGELVARVRQQEAVAGLGLSALSGVSMPELFEEAVLLVARTLGVSHTKV
ncbi:MAG: hypothetical protein ACRDTR_18345, partial [Rubrobacter sp.]